MKLIHAFALSAIAVSMVGCKTTIDDRWRSDLGTTLEEAHFRPVYQVQKEKGIVSVKLYFSLADQSEEALSRLSVMTTLLGDLPTKKHDGPTLQRLVKSLLGEIHYGVEAYGKRETPETCRVFFSVKARFLEKNMDEALSLIAEALDKRFKGE